MHLNKSEVYVGHACRFSVPLECPTYKLDSPTHKLAVQSNLYKLDCPTYKLDSAVSLISWIVKQLSCPKL